MGNISSKAKRIYFERGFFGFLRSVGRFVVYNLKWYFRKTIWVVENKKFVFQGKTYGYFRHRHNVTYLNERIVEIPIVWQITRRYEERNILEVGNVLSHYFKVNHDILDKYEIADRVINQDVVDFSPGKRYDLIISISTLEHVGWNETPKEPLKIFGAIENLRKLLNPKGEMIVTLPLGQNPVLDELIGNEELHFESMFYMKRLTKNNSWQEVNFAEVRGAEYGKPFPAANAIAIGYIKAD